MPESACYFSGERLGRCSAELNLLNMKRWLMETSVLKTSAHAKIVSKGCRARAPKRIRMSTTGGAK